MDWDRDIFAELGPAMDRVGTEALAIAGDETARVLIYGEFSDDMDQLFFRHGPADGTTLRCEDDVPGVFDALRAAWELCRAKGEKYCWRAVIYRVELGKMDVRLLYDDEVDDALTLYDKEERLLETYYPGVEVEPVPQDRPGSVRLLPSRRPPFWKLWR